MSLALPAPRGVRRASLPRPADEATAQAPGRAVPATRRLANAAVAVATFLGGFVIFEPAPYEVMVAALLALWLLFGLRIARPVLPLLVLVVLFNVGGILSVFTMEEWGDGLIYVAVTLFLGLSSVFFALLVMEDPTRLRLIFRAYVVAAIITTLLGIAGYFGVPGFSMFTRYSRLMGAFQDPNVYGPFVVPPILYVMYGLMSRSVTWLPVRVPVLLLLLAGLFLAFSRAAWGLAVVTAALFYILLIVNEPLARMRLRYIVLGVAGVVAVALLILVSLQIPAVADLFSQRVRAVQDYDGGHQGRFARHAAGFLLAFDHPFGIGPLVFGTIFKEDTHQMYLKALMDYGWLGFLSWIALITWTTVAGFRMLFRPRPWQPYFQIAYVMFIGHMFIGLVIDTDHWRHFFLMIGLVWGCIGLETRWQRDRRTAPRDDGPRPMALSRGGSMG